VTAPPAVLRVEALRVPGRLSDVSLAVARGSVHALVGPNGAGKSTVLQAVLGLVAFEGRVTVALSPGGRVGVVPQRFEHPLVLPVSVRDFLAAPRTQWPVALGVPAKVRARVGQALEAVQAAGLEAKLLSELSGGELRKVLLANALDPEPELLLLDEPEAGLDAAGQAWLEATLGALKGRVTMLLVSHDAARVARLADEVTRLEGGRRV